MLRLELLSTTEETHQTSAEVLVTPGLGAAAQRTRDSWDARRFSHTGIQLPRVFAEHRTELMERIGRSTTPHLAASFDDDALAALNQSFTVAERLGVKEMPGNPVRMAKEVGEAYDAYQAQAIDPSAERTKISYTPESIALLGLLAAHFQASRESVTAVAGEYYGRIILPTLVQHDELIAV